MALSFVAPRVVRKFKPRASSVAPLVALFQFSSVSSATAPTHIIVTWALKSCKAENKPAKSREKRAPNADPSCQLLVPAPTCVRGLACIELFYLRLPHLNVVLNGGLKARNLANVITGVIAWAAGPLQTSVDIVGRMQDASSPHNHSKARVTLLYVASFAVRVRASVIACVYVCACVLYASMCVRDCVV